MNIRKYALTILAGIFLFCLQANAQISTNEVPFGYKYNFGKDEQMPVIVMPDIDIIKLQAEDKEGEQLGSPLRFGFIHSVELNLPNAGSWHTLENGDKLCQLTIVCPDALSINLLYDKFWLPDGAKFFVYSNDRRHSIGAFTSVNNKGNRDNIQGFATGLVYGNQVTLEYYLPNEVKEVGVISISGIVHGYKYILPDYGYETPRLGYNLSGDCMVNINCSEGNDWQNEKRAIALILMGNYICTGSLMNNTNKDHSPYFLTADHCLLGTGTGGVNGDAETNFNLNHWTFYWNYELPPNPNGCNYNSTTPSEPFAFSTSGAQVVANSSVSDFALLKLIEDPMYFTNQTPSYYPYYLGWDRTGNSGIGGVCIHHPRGDVKKISTYDITPYSSSDCIIYYYLKPNFWDVKWRQTTNGFSVTEPGSSGSPLINSNKKVIGQLYGPGWCSNVQCENPIDQIVTYGKFSISWTGNNNSSIQRRLDHWLAPGLKVPQTLDGMDSTPISGPDHVFSSATYTLNNGTAALWSVTPSNIFTLTSSGNSAIVTTSNSAGVTGVLTVTTTGGSTFTKTIQSCGVSLFGTDYLGSDAIFLLTATPSGLPFSTSWSASQGVVLYSPDSESVLASPVHTMPLIMPTYPFSPLAPVPLSGTISATVTIDAVNTVLSENFTMCYPAGTIIGPTSIGGNGGIVCPKLSDYYEFTVGSDVPANANVRWVAVHLNSSNPSATATLYTGRTATIYLGQGLNEVQMQYVSNGVRSYPAELQVTVGLMLNLSAPTDTTTHNELNVQLSPNPVTNQLNVTVEDATDPIVVTIYNSSGTMYLSQTFSTSTFTIDLSRCHPGMLVVRIACGDKYAIKNILKQ